MNSASHIKLKFFSYVRMHLRESKQYFILSLEQSDSARYKWQTEVDGGIQVVYIVPYLHVLCKVLESVFTKIKVSMFNHLRFKHDTKTNHVFFIFCFFKKKKEK